MPETSACDELVGSPSHHVIRSHTIAPISAAISTNCVACPKSMKPSATLFATSSPNTKAATKLKNAAQSTA